MLASNRAAASLVGGPGKEMPGVIDIDEVMNQLCRAGVRAVQRYLEVSGEDPWSMPEYFMPSYILDDIGDQITATLETNFGTLVKWNADVRERRGLVQQAHDERLLLLAQQLNGRRVDMVLFEGESEHRPKEQQDILALVEFKRGWIDAANFPGKISDRDKLLMLLAHIDTCPWGVACGWVNEAHLEWQKSESIKGTDDRWYEHKIELPGRITAPLYLLRALVRKVVRRKAYRGFGSNLAEREYPRFEILRRPS